MTANRLGRQYLTSRKAAALARVARLGIFHDETERSDLLKHGELERADLDDYDRAVLDDLDAKIALATEALGIFEARYVK